MFKFNWYDVGIEKGWAGDCFNGTTMIIIKKGTTVMVGL